MSEEEILNTLNNLRLFEYEWWLFNFPEQDKEKDLEMVENAIQGLLDLYNKQKEIIKAKDEYIAGLHQDLQEAIYEIDKLRGDVDE